jgi:hypothetical protein|nr:MAG TPA: hypothetical protein [Bacteriophage sp.]
MADILREVVDYDNKVSIIRSYAYYYTNEDLANIFNASNLSEILANNTYEQIRDKLANTLSELKGSQFELGDVVMIDKPLKFDGTYKNVRGIILGKRVRYSSNNINEYYMEFDVLVQTATYHDGYGYTLYTERDNTLKLVSKDAIDKVELKKLIDKISRLDIIVTV